MGLFTHFLFSLFQTAEYFLQQNGLSFKWEPSGALVYWLVLPALLKHPETGETVWFNQIQSHHTSHLQEMPRLVLLCVCSVNFMPCILSSAIFHITQRLLCSFSCVSLSRNTLSPVYLVATVLTGNVEHGIGRHTTVNLLQSGRRCRCCPYLACHATLVVNFKTHFQGY